METTRVATSIAFLSLATIFNILCNVSLKIAVSRVTSPEPLIIVQQLATSTWAWVGIASGAGLLAFYLLAIRTLDLSLAYSIVTSLALVGISTVGIVFLREGASVAKVFGIILVLIGIVLISRSKA